MGTHGILNTKYQIYYMNTHGFELKSFGLEIVNDLPGYWTGLQWQKLDNSSCFASDITKLGAT